MTNSKFVGNLATDGGAIFVDSTSSMTIRNSVMAANVADIYGGGIRSDGDTWIWTCVLWENHDSGLDLQAAQYYGAPPDIDYCCVQGWTGGLGGVGNIGDDPAFVDADGPDGTPGTADDDLRLADGSPCIDTGDPGFTAAPGAVDLDGHKRVWDGKGTGTAVVDMGAYEFGSHAYGDLNCDGLVTPFDIDPFVLALVAPEVYAASYPGCEAALGDINADGAVNPFDIDPLVRLLTGG